MEPNFGARQDHNPYQGNVAVPFHGQQQQQQHGYAGDQRVARRGGRNDNFHGPPRGFPNEGAMYAGYSPYPARGGDFLHGRNNDFGYQHRGKDGHRGGRGRRGGGGGYHGGGGGRGSRGRGGVRNKNDGGFERQPAGVEQYVKKSMVQDPWMSLMIEKGLVKPVVQNPIVPITSPNSQTGSTPDSTPQKNNDGEEDEWNDDFTDDGAPDNATIGNDGGILDDPMLKASYDFK